MMSSSLGDMAQHLMFRRQIGDAKASNLTLSRELASGLTADTAKRLNGNMAELTGIRSAQAQAAAHSDIGRSAGLLLSVQQGAVETMRGAVQFSLDDMILHASSANDDPNVIRSLAQMQDRFRDAVSTLNTSFGGRSVFGGVSQASKPVAEPDILLGTLLSDMTATLPAPASFSDISTFVDEWFREAAAPDTSPFDSIGYLGGPKVPARLDLGYGQDVDLGVTAQATAFRKTLAGFAKAAILSDGPYRLDPAQKDSAISTLIDDLGSAMAGLIALGAQIGTDEARASRAIAHAEGQKFAMQDALVALLEADPYETAAKLEATMSRLELLFTLTSRLSRLTLQGFLR